jgi:hypothetical protein
MPDLVAGEQFGQAAVLGVAEAIGKRSPGHGHSYLFSGSLTDRGGREMPARQSTFQTVEWANPVAPATSRGPHPVWRRHSQIRSASSADKSRGERCGRLDRSSNALA